jgi:hypothetical protein
MATQYQSETLSDQHAAADHKRTRARKGEKPQAEFYKCRAQLLKQGRTNTHLGATVNKHEGIMLPAGAYYWFEATSKEELILFRIGCRTNDKDPGERVNINGDLMPGESAENKKGVIVYKDGEFFG